MKVSFEGVGEQVLSFNKASGVTKGALVKMSANSTVAADAAAGKVKTVTTGGAQYLVIKVDATAGTVGFIM